MKMFFEAILACFRRCWITVSLSIYYSRCQVKGKRLNWYVWYYLKVVIVKTVTVALIEFYRSRISLEFRYIHGRLAVWPLATLAGRRRPLGALWGRCRGHFWRERSQPATSASLRGGRPLSAGRPGSLGFGHGPKIPRNLIGYPIAN
jgi:hypothetical protein